MFLLITGGSASGKSWIAQEFAGKMDKEQSTVVLDCVAETLTEKIRAYQGEILPQQQIVEEILSEIHALGEQTDNLIVVTNQVFSDVPGMSRTDQPDAGERGGPFRGSGLRHPHLEKTAG